MYLLTHFGAHSFQLKQYAPIEIVKTEMKGFGLRAAQDIQKYVRQRSLMAWISNLLQGRLHL